MTNAARSLQVQLDHTLATTVTQAVIGTISGMTGIRPQPGNFQVVNRVDLHADISGIISMVQDQTDAVLVVSFQKDAIFHILARIYQQQFKDLNHSVQQGVGEFTNIIYCQLKTELNKTGFQFRMALPNVVIGDQHKVTNASGPSLVVPFNVAGHSFHVVLQLRQASEQGRKAA